MTLIINDIKLNGPFGQRHSAQRHFAECHSVNHQNDIKLNATQQNDIQLNATKRKCT